MTTEQQHLIAHLPPAPSRDPGGQRFVLELRALTDDVPAIIRLRQFLKNALRTWRFRCTRISEVSKAS